MSDYGSGPAHDELEITLFGPGFGEGIAVYLGENNWLLVDSCIDPATKGPATHAYLQAIGVQPKHVKTIVASHWHDDHVRGMSRLAAHYPDAEFMLSAVFNSDEASAFLAAYGGSAAPGLARGAKELFSVVAQRAEVSFLQQRFSVLELSANGRNVRVSALSPVPAAFAQSLAHFAQYLPRNVAQINHAPDLRPNHEAVVLHIDFDGDAALLGSDLESHPTCGWGAVVSNAWCAARPTGSAYKVAHHGSYSGDHPNIWATLLGENPTACLTPFNRGHRLPSDEDKARIKANTAIAYLSSGATRRPEMDAAVLKRLEDICKKVSRVNSGFGAIRLRKLPAANWAVELFGAACAL